MSYIYEEYRYRSEHVEWDIFLLYIDPYIDSFCTAGGIDTCVCRLIVIAVSSSELVRLGQSQRKKSRQMRR